MKSTMNLEEHKAMKEKEQRKSSLRISLSIIMMMI